jgi:hypothetical protein
VQHHALTAFYVQSGVVQHRQAYAVLLVQYKGFTDIFYADHLSLMVPIAGWRCAYPAYKKRTCRPDKA